MLSLAVWDYEVIEGMFLVQSGVVLRTGLVCFVLGLKIIVFSSFTVSHESAGFCLVRLVLNEVYT